MKHSELPWIAAEYVTGCVFCTGDDRTVAKCSDMTSAQNMANAAFIVTAANAHYGLVAIKEAAEQAMTLLDILREDHGVGEILAPMYRDNYERIAEQLRAALAALSTEEKNA